MKIKGVKTGAQRGVPIQYEPKEKVREILKDYVPRQAPFGDNWWVEKVVVENFQVTHGRVGPKGFDNNTYQAEGKLFIRKIEDGDLHKIQAKPYKVIFKDVLDENGMPDLEMIKFEGVLK